MWNLPGKYSDDLVFLTNAKHAERESSDARTAAVPPTVRP